MSSLKVLALGNHPNILLYTSRFQLANSVDLYHVSKHESNRFEINTFAYGTEKLVLQNHYSSISKLSHALSNDNKLIFDVIILSASSLQELSSLTSELSNFVNQSTKLFIESSGFVQLESFVKMSMDVPQLNVFSIVTDFDIRQIDSNKYKQFRTGRIESDSKNSIYLGDSSVKSKNYSSSHTNLLKTFERLFQKLFPRDVIDLCNESPANFLAKQWMIAIPTICFDPLLILLEETDPQHLKDQILAKPLISGLVTEVVKISKSMNPNLALDKETDLLDHWSNLYSVQHSMPPLLYHFIHKTAPLNFDISLLQIILLADDFNLKTPYLEFLYSIMTQVQKLNDNHSKWFIRSDGVQDSKIQITNLTNENKNYLDKIQTLSTTITRDQSAIKLLQDSENSLKLQNDVLNNKLVTIEKNNSILIDKYKNEISVLQNALTKNSVNREPVNNQSEPRIKDNNLNRASQQDYKSTGTPLLSDLQEFAGYGVNYGESPSRNNVQSPKKQDVENNNQNNGSGNLNVEHVYSEHRSENSSDTSLKERELELRRKELEIQERELDIQKKALQMQQMQRFPNQQNQFNGNSRKSSFVNMQQQQQQPIQTGYSRSSRMLHGATAPSAYMATNEIVEPVSSNMNYMNNGYSNYQGQNQQYQAHGFKPTSRKNRNSNMPMLGNASNATAFGNYSRPSTGNLNQQNMNQSRINSMSSQNLLADQTRNRQGQGSSSYSGNPRNPKAMGMASNSMASLQQRQGSTTSVSNGMDANLSSNTVIHNTQSLSTNNISSLRQPYSALPLSQTTSDIPKINVVNSTPGSTQEVGQSISLSAPSVTLSNYDTTNISHDSNEDSKKKKKFGFFKKKSKA